MRGIGLMIVAIGLLCTMDAVAKVLMHRGMPVIQILAMRSLVIMPLILLVFATQGKLATLRPTRPLLHACRSLVGFIAPLTFFLGIRHLPLTDAVTVSFSSIFMITLLSIVFLGEKVGLPRWSSIIAGFIGVIIVIGPEGGGELGGYLLILIGSAAYAVLFVSGRYLSSTESVASLVFSFNLGVGVVSLLLLPWYWQPQTLDQYGLLLCLALLAVCGHFLLTLAFSISEASLIAPFEYTAVLWALGFDLLIWQIAPSATTSIGAIIIISSGLYIVYRERLHQ
ncbi:DMT family transporter [Granulosicoccus antarcticus]|uniref:Riboflavin transporter n=1 Tax=Granulosicoccus antarcticus IMCC3135 TaxID=1192854 RepID=A0A2Z2P375_9GAMM|nr:DMT family transporter [Granulosicoccus antarcticus]ASJ75087.1 Riboflavin transporter [Granulosicoccus antarcticus IMCC3135]